MKPMLFIRTKVFKVTRPEMAAIAGVSQATLSRWEAGLLKPGLEASIRIREAAKARRIRWRDEWFFSAPEQASEQAVA